MNRTGRWALAVAGLAAALAPVWLIGGGSPAPAAERGVGDELLLANPDTAKIQVYPKHYARFELDVVGDAGSRVRMSVFWDGVYLVPVLDLTRQLRAGNPNIPVYVADRYHLIPMKATYRIVGRTEITYDHEDTTFYAWCKHRAFWNARTTVEPPLPPLDKPASSNEGQRWQVKYRGWVDEGDAYKWATSIMIVDRRLAGGGVKVVPGANFLGKGLLPVHTTFRSVDKSTGREMSGSYLVNVPLACGLGVDPAAVSPQTITTSLARMDWGTLCDATPMLTPMTLDYNELSLGHRGSVSGEPDLVGHYRKIIERWAQGGKATLYSDKKATARFSWSVGLKTEVEATLEPVASDEKSFLPTPNMVRKYKLKINKPTPDRVQAVQIWLEGVSSHPGITTNAGQHHLWAPFGSCPHCNNCQTQTVAHYSNYHDWSTSPPTLWALPRYYTHYNDCALDSVADMFFRDFDNDGWEQGENAFNQGLQYTISDELLRDEFDSDEYTISLAIEDAAASGFLMAEILVNNVWTPVKCLGPTADEFGLTLAVPLDKDGNGIGDAWSAGAGQDGLADAETSANGKNVGDGLTLFEEYRGVYTAGMNHERLSPKMHDLFVHDYTHKFTNGLAGVASRYDPEGVWVHRLDDGQFKDDVVNWASDYQAGKQYMLVIMDGNVKPDHVPQSSWDAIWKIAGGFASDVSPPADKCNTIFVRSPGDFEQFIGLLAHEIGHNINCRHHGELNKTVTLTGDELAGQPLADGDYYVAVTGGQNSGDTTCFMRYQSANLACSDPAVPLPVKSHASAYAKYIWPGTRQVFCNAKDSNVAPFLGAASVGNCQNQIKIKSYTGQSSGSMP